MKLPTLNKFSGRLFLVICVGLSFVYGVCMGWIKPEDQMLVTILVARDYFGRDRSEPNGNP